MLPQDNRFHVGNNSISRYFLVANCPVCDTESQGGICLNCLTNPQKSAIILMDRIRKWERRYYDIAKVKKNVIAFQFYLAFSQRKLTKWLWPTFLKQQRYTRIFFLPVYKNVSF